MNLRSWLIRHPRLKHMASAIRVVAMLGPWHSLLLAYCRKFANNPRPEPVPVSRFPNLNPTILAARLHHDGWADGIQVPAELIDQIVAYTEHLGRSRYDAPHQDCEAVLEIARDPNVLEVARRHLGAEPILFRTVIWRNFGLKNLECVPRSHIYRFHFDVADVKSLVLFIYLSDVDELSGPHAVISGTHRRKSFWDTLRVYLDDRTAQARYGNQIRIITGPRGTAFFEEQTTYHKQVVPRKPRMMLAITYTLWREPGRHRFLPRRNDRRAEDLQFPPATSPLDSNRL